MKQKPKRENVGTCGHIIADANGWVQLHSLRSSPAKAWEALYACKLTASERDRLRRQGFRSEMVWIESFHKRPEGSS